MRRRKAVVFYESAFLKLFFFRDTNASLAARARRSESAPSPRRGTEAPRRPKKNFEQCPGFRVAQTDLRRFARIDDSCTQAPTMPSTHGRQQKTRVVADAGWVFAGAVDA
jgi:hypothetical protein